MKRLIVAVLVCLSAFAQAQVGKGDIVKTTVQLLNGKNLDGWYSFLATKGKNNDPDKVFTVEDGLLHVSGKEFGYICTNKVYKNFVLTVEFKWGEKKYPPRDADTTRRDNGILFFVPVNAKDTVWPRSIECQIQEGDVGDFWMVDSATIVVDGIRTIPKDYCRAKKKVDTEKPHGQWNTVTIKSLFGKITFEVNGTVVNSGEQPSISEGKITIQSEGAEIFYRKAEITDL